MQISVGIFYSYVKCIILSCNHVCNDVCRGTELHCTDCLRVTVGTRDENEKFLSLLASTAKELGIF